ncbi:MAG: hydantoinase/oxoprolinase family protein [Planctomycetes bacterium]|nr:hydantoinase/oxoprolinase family protein [Planctomycetota bacterium]
MARGAKCTIGVDTGGTFTDLVAYTDGEFRVAKLPSTPDDPARAVVEGVHELGGPRADQHVVHGTTVALNALLSGRTARTALVTNRGFADVLEIARQDRPELYALHPAKPSPLVPRELRFEVNSRIWPKLDGSGYETVARPTKAELARLVRDLRRARPQSIVIGLLHSYARPEIERELARALRPLGVPLTLSAEILPEHREYERFSTAAVNAALEPLVRDYLRSLGARLAPARLSVMQSAGGTLAAERAAEQCARILLSGPAGGVVGAARAAHEAGFERMVGFDMGGTSTDVAFHGARTRLAGEARRIAGHAVGVPMLDIHTIGCGGGSLVEVDADGVLHVGPKSAGADPGPVCYGKSDRLTVTDAHVLLGHVARGAFLGGALELDVERVARAFEKLARRLGTPPHAAAEIVLEVARASMRRALGVMTMQRGEDPRAVPLVGFGGAGGLHAAALAESASMPCALVPRFAGLLSAYGMATADALAERSASVLTLLSRLSARELAARVGELARAARAELLADGQPARAIELEPSADVRYAGQSFELGVPLSRTRGGATPAALVRAFTEAHRALYGFVLDGREIELVQLRVRARVAARVPRADPPRRRASAERARLGERAARFGRHGLVRRTPVFDQARMPPGSGVAGPALIEDFSGTTLVPPGWRARVVGGGHLLLARR